MGILSRFGDIMASNINALLDKAEDPSKMIDQYLRNATEDLAKVKEETAGVIAEEKRCKRLLDEANENVTKYMALAQKAVAAGNDDDARVFLSKKQESESAVATAQKSYDVAHANADRMRQMHDKLQNDIVSLRSRREQIKATVAVAKTQERVNKAQEAMNGSRGALDNFARMEDKANEMLARAEAKAELNMAPADPADELEKKYGRMGSASVEDELAALKAKMSSEE